ncbi:aluminum-activated malate transporter 12-like [Phalaenopsis equestris]|uniref:aluminum-activated malate transporter 12-like n=1 Tax=Phalaenopsis equestris TaxID=78828 RepID=UPI0009E3255E|nr:aluminum-activated malate transporter 12-like [Phalaenopsis equestris]
MDFVTETHSNLHDRRDSLVIPIDGIETLGIDTKRLGWRKVLRYVAQVIRVADYKKTVHAIKFGLALVLVSLLYMLEAVHDKLGDNAMWAVMTVVVVFEYTAGATISKGLNRLVGTVLGGGLGSLVAIIAQEIGGVGKAVVIGISIFILGAAATYLRTILNIRKKYDYGVMIFILTLSLVSISGVRVDEIIHVAGDRLLSICMGFVICAFISLFIFPIWAGDELHSSLASKFNSIAHAIEDCMKKGMDEARKPLHCLSVLSSKTSDESLALKVSNTVGHNSR